jgi:hypothetical protein
MSTRCTVRIYDGEENSTPEEHPVMLYHHSDGYPSFMVPLLKRFLEETRVFLQEAGFPYWWDSERVAAVMILLSAEDEDKPIKPFTTDKLLGSYNNNLDTKRKFEEFRPNGGVPVFQPCAVLHGDLEYVYDVYLSGQGTYKILVRDYLKSGISKPLVLDETTYEIIEEEEVDEEEEII